MSTSGGTATTADGTGPGADAGPAAAAGTAAEAGTAGLDNVPDSAGHFGRYGGRFAPEALMAALDELTVAYAEARSDPAFQAELDALLRDYAGRPTQIGRAHV